MNVALIEKLAKLFNYNPDGSKSTEPVQEESTLAPQAEAPAPEERSFWQIYTPLNILREMRYRIFEVYTPMNILREIRFRLTGK
jgi:hypothetical protein